MRWARERTAVEEEVGEMWRVLMKYGIGDAGSKEQRDMQYGRW